MLRCATSHELYAASFIRYLSSQDVAELRVALTRTDSGRLGLCAATIVTHHRDGEMADSSAVTVRRDGSKQVSAHSQACPDVGQDMW